jgi:2-phosphoglycolate phosphatase
MGPPRPRSAPPKSRRRAVLVDLDGTLLDSRLSIRETLNTVLAERGLTPFSRADMDHLIGKPLRDILADRTADPAAIEAMTHRYRAAYNETGWVTVDPFPGLVPLLRDLRAQGIATATVTSKGQLETETLLFDLGLGDLFDVIVGDDDVRPLKPDPAPVREACRLLGVDPADAVMVGDTTFDVRSARAAGAACVGVLWGIHDAATLRDAGATCTVRTPAQLASELRLLLRQTQERAVA